MRIMTDAAADFTAEELERYGVHSIATGVMLNGEAVDPDHPLSDEEFWQQVLAGAAVKTSQPSPGAFAEAFEQAQSEDQDVLYVSISSALSGTMQSAHIAAAALDGSRIHIVDSLTGAAAQKLLVLHACRLRDEGRLRAREIAEKLEQLRGRVRLFASLDTLDSLARSGRIPQVLASIGSFAHLKPILTVNEEGKIVLCDKAFGRSRAISRLAAKVASMKIDPRFPVIPLFSCDRANCQSLIKKLSDLGVKVNEGMLSAIGPSIGGHIGPNAYGVVFVENE